ncbi:MAG: hypothetical protein ACR2JE_08220 [Acidobacteriaceae bacterium]
MFQQPLDPATHLIPFLLKLRNFTRQTRDLFRSAVKLMLQSFASLFKVLHTGLCRGPALAFLFQDLYGAKDPFFEGLEVACHQGQIG